MLASLWNGKRPEGNWYGNKSGTCLKVSRNKINNETMQHVVVNHIEVNLLQPLTKKLIINAFSQEVVNAMLSVPMRNVSCSSSTCWMSTQDKKLGSKRLALPAASSPGDVSPYGELDGQSLFPGSHQALTVCVCWEAQSLQRNQAQNPKSKSMFYIIWSKAGIALTSQT